jgi:hypothetical protein
MVASMTPANVPQAETRAAGIRCIGNVVEACGDMVKAEGVEMFGGLMNMLPTLQFDDPAVIAIKECSANFATGLKELFVPYMQPVMTEIFKDASNNFEIHLTDTEAPDNPTVDASHSAVQVPLPGLGTKQITINTTALEAKIKAVKLIYDFVEALGKHYSPFVEGTM